MANKRKYISTEYGMINLRDGDTILHLDPEFLVDIYWRVFDGELTEVVRCKDCKYFDLWGPKGKEKFDCDRFIDSPPITPEWYCAWGERREDVNIS